MRRSVVAVAAVLGLVLGPARVATGAYSEDNGITFIGPHHQDAAHLFGSLDCVWNAVRISNDWGQPWLSSRVSLEKTIVFPDNRIHECGDQYYTAEITQLAVRQDLYYYDVHWLSWMRCNAGPWLVNNQRMQDLTTTFAWANRPCPAGTRYYGASQGATFWNHWHYGVETRTLPVILR